MKNFELRKTIPVEDLGNYMRRWQQLLSDFVQVDSIGMCSGYNIWSARFTINSNPDDEKEIVLIMAQHSGMEITGTKAVLSLGNYLAAGDQLAREILAKLIVELVPCPNPLTYSKSDTTWQYRNATGRDEYTRYFGFDSPIGDPEELPSAAALRRLIDELKPELILDSQGLWWEEQLVSETFGISFSSLNRVYDRGFADEVQRAALERRYAVFSEDMLYDSLRRPLS